MADTNYLLSRGFNAGSPLSRGRAVKAGSNPETVVPVTAANDVVLGVGEFDVSAAEISRGKGQNVHMAGIVEMEASAAIAVGDLVAIAADGRAAPAASGRRVIGVCVGYPAAAAGDHISVLLGLPGYVV